MYLRNSLQVLTRGDSEVVVNFCETWQNYIGCVSLSIRTHTHMHVRASTGMRCLERYKGWGFQEYES